MTDLVAFSQSEKTVHNSHKFGFTLSSTNYGFWKTMIQPFLITNSLFGYIDGTIPSPSPTISITSSTGKDKEQASVQQVQPNPQHAIWVSNDAHIRMLLLSTISESSFQHVHGSTSRDLWQSLERAYAPHTASREYTLKTQLLRIEMKKDETTSAYLTRAQEYATALANIGEPMKEKDIVMLVISGLREEYNGLKTTALTRQLAFNELHALFADHDYMHKKTVVDIPPTQAFTAARKPAASAAASSSGSVSQSDAIHAIQQLAAQLGLQLQLPSSQPQAYYTNRNSNRNHNNRQGNGRGRGGHNSYNNRNNTGGNRNQFNWASNQNTVYGTCNRCGIGHVPSECPNRDPATFRSRQQPSANYAEHRSRTFNNWLPDTGSNNHVAVDLSSFDNSEPYNGDDSLHVGNGQVYTHYPPHGSK